MKKRDYSQSYFISLDLLKWLQLQLLNFHFIYLLVQASPNKDSAIKRAAKAELYASFAGSMVITKMVAPTYLECNMLSEKKKQECQTCHRIDKTLWQTKAFTLALLNKRKPEKKLRMAFEYSVFPFHGAKDIHMVDTCQVSHWLPIKTGI